MFLCNPLEKPLWQGRSKYFQAPIPDIWQIKLLIATDPIKKLIQEHARVAEIVAVCLEEGMRTLKMDGIEKVLQGITDIAQVRAVCIK